MFLVMGAFTIVLRCIVMTVVMKHIEKKKGTNGLEFFFLFMD
jgi:hypothetical protein